MMPDDSLNDLRAEVEALRLRLEEAEQALEAIRTGQVESLVVEGPNGPRIFSLEGADHSYRVLVEAMSEGAVTLGEDGTILYCNTRFAEMLDAPLERVMGGAIFGFLPYQSREAFEALVREAEGGASRGELQLLGRAGQVVPAYLSLSVINDDGRRCFCLVATDLRAQKRSEELEAARQHADNEKRRLEAVMEALPVGVAITDAQGGNIQSNKAFEQLWSEPLPPIRTFADYSAYQGWWAETGKALAPQEWASAEAARKGEPVVGQFLEIQKFDGSRAFVINSAAPVRDAFGKVVGCAVAIQDISALKRAEEALREADLHKNAFLAALSHELRNPLTPIRNSLFILDRATPGSDQAQRAKAVIDRQVGQLTRLVDDLLDLTRITKGKMRIQRARFELGEIVQQIVEDLRSEFATAGVELEVRVARKALWVNADAERITQALGNLLQNAVKFTRKSGRVTVTLNEDDARGMAVIHVRDTGIGIAPDVLPRLFRPFTQADSTLHRGRGGLGLGLALVKSLVELHGGTVDAYSDGLDKGAEFVVQLPLVGEETAAPRASRTSVPRSRRRVLIIEDNIDAADTLREALGFGEHEVEVAYNGPDGISKARQFRPDVVLCDIGLPGMDGYEVARVFRADETLKGVCLVALTGYALPEDLQRASDAGFDRHLAKPPSMQALEELLAEAPPLGGTPIPVG
jgi:PAS domain S-box-containing protein